MSGRWSPLHLRLHRLLLQDPALLPRNSRLLLAVSGGQDSMALTGLLLDLMRLHGWTLELWHGDHGWRAESARQARELAAWAHGRGLPITVTRWQQQPRHNAGASTDPHRSEARARAWRYGCLLREAQRQGAVRVLTGHTASDRAETLLLQLARGSHRRGLASLPQERELGAGIPLVRPMLGFSRDDTGAICRHLALPIWPDSSNADPRFSRNRLRHEVLPVLEALHPGASRRLAATAERLAAELETEQELLALALKALMPPAATPAVPAVQEAVGSTPSPARCPALQRQELVGHSRANQRRLLQLWISQRTGRALASRPLEQLLQRLGRGQPPGALDLPAGWQLHWDRHTLQLDPPLQQP